MFAFALDAEGVSAGRAIPPIGPITIIALLLLVGALLGTLLGTLLTLAGRSLPRTVPETSRLASSARAWSAERDGWRC